MPINKKNKKNVPTFATKPSYPEQLLPEIKTQCKERGLKQKHKLTRGLRGQSLSDMDTDSSR